MDQEVLKMSVSPLRKMALAAALTVTAGWAMPAMAQDATVDQVYSAAKAGQVDQALQLMQPVLKDHPNSAKAHFVEAELLAKAHRYADARRTGQGRTAQAGPALRQPPCGQRTEAAVVQDHRHHRRTRQARGGGA
jgi:predicted Zn-dependent protease